MGPAKVDYEIVVCTRNRATLLEGTLESFSLAQLPGGASVLVTVVDNASSDNTRAVVEAWEGRLRIRYLLASEPGKSKALNLALDSALGECIIFTDDDVRVKRGWMLAVADTLSRFPNATALGGPVLPWFEVEPPQPLLDAFPVLKSGYCGLDPGLPAGPVPADLFFVGANMAVRRALIGSLRFDPNLGPGRLAGGEETAFLAHLKRAGAELVWSPDMIVEHYVPESRATLESVLSFMYENGRVTVHTRGVPGGTRILGVPRWLISSMVSMYWRYLCALASGKPVAALTAKGAYFRFRGMMAECYALRDMPQRPSEAALPWS